MGAELRDSYLNDSLHVFPRRLRCFLSMTLYCVNEHAGAAGNRRPPSVFVLAVAPSQYWGRISTISETERGTALERQRLWASARRMFYDSPIWGVGAANYGVHVSAYAFDSEPERRMNLWGEVPHSLYCELLAEFGLIDVELIAWQPQASLQLGKEQRHLASLGLPAWAIQASWVGFLVSATFLSVLDYPHLYYLAGLAVALRRMALERAMPSTAERGRAR
jgi:hypothetical protein